MLSQGSWPWGAGVKEEVWGISGGQEAVWGRKRVDPDSNDLCQNPIPLSHATPYFYLLGDTNYIAAVYPRLPTSGQKAYPEASK